MKRALVFLLLGPVLGALGFVAVAVIASGEIHGDYGEGCAISFMFSLIVSAIAGTIDGLQAYAMPISLKSALDGRRRRGGCRRAAPPCGR